MIDFGMPTLIELPDIEACAKLCENLGLRFIELNMNLPEYQLHIIDADKLNEIAIKYGIYYTIHIDENFNACDFNPLIANAYLETMIKTILLAKKLCVPVLNMHLSKGVYFTLPDRKVFLFDEYKELYLKSICDFRDKCEKAIGDGKIKISIENSDGYADFQIEALDSLLKSSVFGLTFDIGHNHGIGGTDEPIIMERSNRLCHFHFHDAIGEKNHLALGCGEIALDKYLSLARKTSSRVVLETKTIEGLKESVQRISERVKPYDK